MTSLSALESLPKRERWLAILALTVLCYAVLDLTLLLPQRHRLGQAQSMLRTAHDELEQIKATLARIPQKDARPIPAPESHRLAGLADFMLELRVSSTPLTWHIELQHLLDRHSGLRLQRIRIQPATPLFSRDELALAFPDEAQQARPMLWESAEFSITGSYPVLLALLLELERAAPDAYWAEARLQASHPESTLTLVVRQIFSPPGRSP